MAEGVVQGRWPRIPPPDAVCPWAALHLEEGHPAWVPIVTIDSAVFLQKVTPWVRDFERLLKYWVFLFF